MTPKSKAKELFKKYSKGKDKHGWSLCEWDSGAKECALISIEFAREFITGDLNESFDKTMYLFEVKKEIEKL